MHNPQPLHWLARIAVLTLVVCGENEGIVTLNYDPTCARLIPGARFETIAAAGHHLEIEQQEERAALVGSLSGR